MEIIAKEAQTLCEKLLTENIKNASQSEFTKFEDNTQLSFDKRYEKAETQYDILDEKVKRSKKHQKTIEDSISIFKLFIKTLENENAKILQLYEEHNRVLDILEKLETQKCQDKIEKIKQMKIQTSQKAQEASSLQVTPNGGNCFLTSQIESLTSKNVKQVIFYDTAKNKDKIKNFFCNSVVGKQNLCVVVEDNYSNVFGGVFYEKVTKVNDFISDKNASIFTIKRNGAYSVQKFAIGQTEECFKRAFIVNSDRHPTCFAFGIGYDIGAMIVDGEMEMSFTQKSYTAPCGCFISGEKSKLKQIWVLQLI
ncbi:hypothetical protein EIN_480860 [Entamoeba invadens IP1]|uniref:TLDc domain-containing protein n=1 Tax=Entamoeba invadens IP1 TaxID=370355 RepID=L7FPG0_ENTIV|nr:hypothetical protein EIN_480860 [Entamoeba invadens IP1]ELP91157.1 hypothetical protein EIN_480860 [Entamoeba invadens IP1]|eukprot:XP_004257928.1 hypothetical protein EIN_480860 [Entamoeba invadens IP1]